MFFKYSIEELRYYYGCFDPSFYRISNILEFIPTYLYESLIPNEIIAIIWSIKLLQEDFEFEEYAKDLTNEKNTKLVEVYKLRNKKIYKYNIIGKLFYECTYIFRINDINSTLVNKEYKTIKLLNNLFFKYYEWIINVNNDYNIFINLINTFEYKVNKFYNEIKNNESKIKSKSFKRKALTMLSNMKYFIDNFNCITSYNPCNNCCKFNKHIFKYLDNYKKNDNFYFKNIIVENCLNTTYELDY